MPIDKQYLPPISEKPYMLPVAGLVFGVFVWVVDALVDVFILDEEQGLLENIMAPEESTELWMRSMVVVVFLIMGFFSRHILLKHIALDRILMDYQQRLEEIVSERTEDLLNKTRELEILASTDPLTSLFNRRKFTEVLELEIKRFHRYQQAFCIINIDIDYFKAINDQYGHEVGDLVIREFAELLQSGVRRSDSAGRWGGEEFVLLIIESTQAQAVQLAEKLKKILEGKAFGVAGQVTASMGISEVKQGDNFEDIIRRSDQALYKAKENGRNRIEVI